MPDDADAIEQLEIDVDMLVNAGHKQGLNYRQILRVFLVKCMDLQIQAEAEHYMKGGE
uniref:Uncharacterized protein n=1 Tax=viral metagenome TaxID=1070528 RepID=A0A6M3KV12_9ZZZZ